MAEGRRLKVPDWSSLGPSLERSLGDFLPQGISVTVVEEGKGKGNLGGLRNSGCWA